MTQIFSNIGIIGAGQLARLSVDAAEKLGINLLLLANDSSDSGAQVCKHVVGDCNDLETVRAFAKNCDVITFEHELISLDIIKTLESEGVVVRPSSLAFTYSQDKAVMREKLKNFPAPKFQIISEADQVQDFPVIVKAIKGGYDGRGVWKVDSKIELMQLLHEYELLLVEELIDFDFEIAVMVARSFDGIALTWPPTQTIQTDGICSMTISPAPKLSIELSRVACQLALQIASEVDVVGVMAVEMFVRGEDLFINELAMRPHNSAHWSIEGSKTSQFEQHLRAVAGLELGESSMNASFAVMGNILGSAQSDLDGRILKLVKKNPSLAFHNYMKEARPGRKLGHVTLLGEDLVELTREVQIAIDYMSGEVNV